MAMALDGRRRDSAWRETRRGDSKLGAVSEYDVATRHHRLRGREPPTERGHNHLGRRELLSMSILSGRYAPGSARGRVNSMWPRRTCDFGSLKRKRNTAQRFSSATGFYHQFDLPRFHLVLPLYYRSRCSFIVFNATFSWSMAG